jgi:hypothetical protein
MSLRWISFVVFVFFVFQSVVPAGTESVDGTETPLTFASPTQKNATLCALCATFAFFANHQKISPTSTHNATGTGTTKVMRYGPLLG